MKPCLQHVLDRFRWHMMFFIAYLVAFAGPAYAATSDNEKPAGLPQLNVDTYPSQIFWLFVTFSILYVLMRRHCLPRVQEVMHTREQHISENLKAAREMREKAEILKVEYEHLLTQADSNARRFLNESLNETSLDTKLKLQEISDHISERISRAEAEITSQKREIMKSASKLSKDLAETIVKDVIFTNLPQEPKKQLVGKGA